MEAKKPRRAATIVVCITRSCWSSGKWVKKLELSLKAKSPQGCIIVVYHVGHRVSGLRN